MKEYKINVSRQDPSASLRVKSGQDAHALTDLTEEVYVAANHPWDAAHNYVDETISSGNAAEYAEPEIDSVLYGTENAEELKLKSDEDGYLQAWPKPEPADDIFVWHLGTAYSQLAEARERVSKLVQEKCIRIAHIDTGYQENHPSLPPHLLPGKSFIDDEDGMTAVDRKRNSFQEQEGHGTATMSLLAGGKVTKTSTGDRYEGFFGAIPFAEILPLRICDTVALIRSNSFVKAIEYAIEEKCEVISMSMAGAPTKEWAKAVNKAYEAGIVIVTAAGNSWTEGVQKLLPKRLLYPARWNRVIAATGVTADHNPYVFEAPRLLVKTAGGESMQGNFGPSKAMKDALAAYTPNTSWATMNDAADKIWFTLDGGGTSSATPQVAAAAALWICYNRDKLNKLAGDNPDDRWKKVEAVKYALYESASRDYAEWEKYLGRGSLRASKALDIFPADKDLVKAKKAKVSLDGILDLLGILLRIKDDDKEMVKDEMYTTELLQVLHADPSFHFLLDYEEDEVWNKTDKEKAKELLKRSRDISNALKEKINHLGV